MKVFFKKIFNKCTCDDDMNIKRICSICNIVWKESALHIEKIVNCAKHYNTVCFCPGTVFCPICKVKYGQHEDDHIKIIADEITCNCDYDIEIKKLCVRCNHYFNTKNHDLDKMMGCPKHAREYLKLSVLSLDTCPACCRLSVNSDFSN